MICIGLAMVIAYSAGGLSSLLFEEGDWATVWLVNLIAGVLSGALLLASMS